MLGGSFFFFFFWIALSLCQPSYVVTRCRGAHLFCFFFSFSSLRYVRRKQGGGLCEKRSLRTPLNFCSVFFSFFVARVFFFFLFRFQRAWTVDNWASASTSVFVSLSPFPCMCVGFFFSSHRRRFFRHCCGFVLFLPVCRILSVDESRNAACVDSTPHIPFFFVRSFFFSFLFSLGHIDSLQCVFILSRFFLLFFSMPFWYAVWLQSHSNLIRVVLPLSYFFFCCVCFVMIRLPTRK